MALFAIIGEHRYDHVLSFDPAIDWARFSPGDLSSDKKDDWTADQGSAYYRSLHWFERPPVEELPLHTPDDTPSIFTLTEMDPDQDVYISAQAQQKFGEGAEDEDGISKYVKGIFAARLYVRMGVADIQNFWGVDRARRSRFLLECKTGTIQSWPALTRETIQLLNQDMLLELSDEIRRFSTLSEEEKKAYSYQPMKISKMPTNAMEEETPIAAVREKNV